MIIECYARVLHPFLLLSQGSTIFCELPHIASRSSLLYLPPRYPFLGHREYEPALEVKKMFQRRTERAGYRTPLLVGVGLVLVLTGGTFGFHYNSRPLYSLTK
jgi:hypothetical protein